MEFVVAWIVDGNFNFCFPKCWKCDPREQELCFISISFPRWIFFFYGEMLVFLCLAFSESWKDREKCPQVEWIQWLFMENQVYMTRWKLDFSWKLDYLGRWMIIAEAFCGDITLLKLKRLIGGLSFRDQMFRWWFPYLDWRCSLFFTAFFAA